jgi:PAS domain S-box-containing protein
VPVGQTSLGRIAETRTPWSTNDAGDADLPDPDWVRRERLVSFAGYPLVLGGRVVGVMAMFGRDPLRAQALEPLASIARTIALGIERKGLEASRKRFADLLDAASDFVTIGRPYGPALYINPAARRALGIGDTEQIESLAAFRSPESKRHFDEVALPAALRDGSWRGEAEYVARDGRAIPVSQVLVSHRHAAAGTPLLSAISRDITDSKRAEERTRLLARAIESTTEMVGVTDLDNRFTFVNRAFLETYGYAADEVLGRTPAILQAPDEAGAAVKDIARAAHQGGWHGELVHRRRDGTELSVSLTSSVIRDDDDRPIGVLGVARDITDRLRAERAVRDAEERLEFALRASGVGVWEVNLTTGTVFWSETCERMHGLDTGAFPGRLEAFVESVLPDDRTQVQEAIDRAIRDRTDVVLEYRTQWPDNRIRQISSTGRFFYDDAGTPVRGAGIAVDITERRSLEDQLRQAQKMEAIGQLAGGIAHDFNNLLTAILGYAGLLGESLAPGDTRREDLDEIRQATDRAVALTRQLLAFSRKQILSPRVLRVGDVVSRLVPMLRRLLGETIDVKTVIADDGAVKADVGQLEQVLVNLSVNARDAMVDGGSLTIETVDVSLDDSYVRQHGEGSAGRFVMLSVADTGHGMDAATREHVFEPFFTTKPEGRGTGLGLSTVHGIVHQSGGHVWVYSEVGHGTVFKVYLPRTDEVETPPEPEDDIRVLRGTETILLVEDEDVVREFAHKVLTRQGYAVHALADPGQALAFARAHSGTVDLLLTDVVLPRTNGRHLAEAVSALHPEAGILYMSGYTDDAIVRHGVLEPGTRFLQKPFASDALLRKVRQVIEARRASG